MKKISSLIKSLYLLLFFVTPLIFTFFNSELFELPKMYFVYLTTSLIAGLHFINWLLGNTKLYHKNIFNLPLLLFLISQIICTFTSIDIYTSVYGYPSRLNGGLISTLTYLSLFWCLIPYLDEKFKQHLINFSLISGSLVAIYGILEHFGIDQNLWVQDVQSRVFSTLGQPNWLAAYLCILLPFSIYKNLISPTKKLSTFYFLLSTCLFVCLLFTKSKSGVFAGVISISIFALINFIKNNSSRKLLIINYSLFIILSLLITNPIKDSFISFIKTKHISPIVVEDKIEPSKLLITSSGDIRKIVWHGSLDLFSKFPLFGTGVETFAYSYYWTRPVEHNLTSEWDFLYNKAHNEYLNYLATTGLVGAIPYLFLIFTVLFYLIKTSKIHNLSTPILCSFISILITNAAGFSVVTISLFFFLLPALSLPQTNQANSSTNKFKKVLILPTIIFFFAIIINIFSDYLADIFHAKSQSSNNQQDYASAYSFGQQSLNLSPNNPNYLIDQSDYSAKMALLSKDQTYIDQAVSLADQATNSSPANINFWKQKAQTYYYLSTLDSQYFYTAIESLLQAAQLAPTDAKIFYSLGKFLETASLPDDAIFYYQKAIDLKSNYDYAYAALGEIYFNQQKYDLAKENLEQTLKYAPANTDAQEMLNEINQIQKK